MLDYDDPCMVAVPHLCALFIGQTGHKLFLGQVKLFSGAEDNRGLLGNHGAVDGDLVKVLPVVVSVINIKDDLCADSSGQHNSLEGSLSGRALCKSSAGDQDRLCLFDILFFDIINGELQVSYAVTIHQDAALDGRLHLGESQTELLAVCTSADVGGINALLIEIINNEIAELVIGDLADKTGLHAVMGDADCDVRRRTTDEFLKIVNLLQRLEILFYFIAVCRVEVDTDSSQQDQIIFSGLVEINVIHYTPPMNSHLFACLLLRALFSVTVLS